MNTGLQDAHNLAMLLADVAQGRELRRRWTATSASVDLWR